MSAFFEDEKKLNDEKTKKSYKVKKFIQKKIKPFIIGLIVKTFKKVVDVFILYTLLKLFNIL